MSSAQEREYMILEMPLYRAMELLPGIWQRHLGHRVYYARLKMRGLYYHPDSIWEVWGSVAFGSWCLGIATGSIDKQILAMILFPAYYHMEWIEQRGG